MTEEYIKNRMLHFYPESRQPLRFYVTDDFGNSHSIGTKPPWMYSAWWGESYAAAWPNWRWVIEEPV